MADIQFSLDKPGDHAHATVIVADALLLDAVPAGAHFATPVYQINCGGPFAGAFAPDAFFTGGFAFPSNNLPISIADANVMDVPQAAPSLVYKSVRADLSAFGYAFPNLKAGQRYNVRLHFIENGWTVVGKRPFTVTVNAKVVLTGFDPGTAAGGVNKVIIEEFQTMADASGHITVSLSANPGLYPMIAAVEVMGS